MTTFNVLDYWPNPQRDGTTIIEYLMANGAASSKSVYVFDAVNNRILLLDHLGTGEWLDTWFLRSDPVRGLVEFGDMNPQSGLSGMLFGNKLLMYKNGREILWGGVQQVGQTISNIIEIDYATSRGVFPPFKGSWSFGWQAVTFTALHANYTDVNGVEHADVLDFTYRQTWNGTTVGAVFRNKKNVGTIEVQWIKDNVVTGKLATRITRASV